MMEDINLTKNFKLRELLRSNTAKKLGIDNDAPSNVVANLQYLCEQCLQPAREYFGVPIRITSGYRCPALNKAVKGSPASFHAIGCAADIDFGADSKLQLADLFKFFYDRGVYTELIAEELPSGWIHIAIQKGREKENQLKYKLAGESVKKGTYDKIVSLIA